jgi:hypothetical protein
MTAKARTNVSRLLVKVVWDVLVGVGDGVGVGWVVEVVVAPDGFGVFGVFGAGVMGRTTGVVVVPPCCGAGVVTGGGVPSPIHTQSSLRLTTLFS